MTTWGDVVPRMRSIPGYGAMAASPYTGPALPTGKSPVRFEPIRPIAPFPDAGPDGGKLRVGLWSPVLFEAGAEAWMLALARALADRVSWRGLAIASGPEVAPAMLDRFAALMPVGHGRDACTALAASCDVVVSWAMSDVPGLLAGLRRPPRVVSVCHAPVDSEWGMSSYRDPAGIDAYVAVSELALGPICESRRAGAKVIWNAVDGARMVVGRDRAAMRYHWGVPPGAKVVGYMGRLAHEKRPGVLAGMLAALPREWHAVLVGSGVLRGAVEAEAARLGVADRLHLAGPDHAAGDVLGAFDALVVPSEYESFCLTLAEGLWAGVPVVSTPVGLARIVPGLTREAPIGADGPAIAAAVLADQADPAGTRARVEHARSFARARLSPARFGREWASFLRGLAPPRAMDPARLALLAETCPSSSGPCGCGSGPPRQCGHPDRPALVRKAECLRCSGASWWESGVEPAW